MAADFAVQHPYAVAWASALLALVSVLMLGSVFLDFWRDCAEEDERG